MMKHYKSQVSGGFYMEDCPSIGSKMLWIMNTTKNFMFLLPIL
jgi:hypothetical protein